MNLVDSGPCERQVTLKAQLISRSCDVKGAEQEVGDKEQGLRSKDEEAEAWGRPDLQRRWKHLTTSVGVGG